MLLLISEDGVNLTITTIEHNIHVKHKISNTKIAVVYEKTQYMIINYNHVQNRNLLY